MKRKKSPAVLDAEIAAALAGKARRNRAIHATVKPLQMKTVAPNPEKLWPWNEAFDTARVEWLTDNMRAHGWQGDPLVVVETAASRPGVYRALTGSHRLEAAARTDTKVPIVVLTLPPGWRSTWEGLYRNGKLQTQADVVAESLVEDGVDSRFIPLLDS